MNKYSNNGKFNSNKDTLLSVENNIHLNKIKSLFISSKNSNRGITMVALVITIVVLLILAGISISALSGDNGIINKAQNAKNDTEYASIEEQIDLAIIDAESKHRNPTMDNVIDELIDRGVISDESQVDKTTGTITTKEPEYVIEGKLDDYIVPPLDSGVIVSDGPREVIQGEQKAWIPDGYMIVPGLEDISKGLVISDNPNDTESEDETLVAEGNQFVWIPVETPVADKEEDGTTNKAMAIKQGDNYRGLLYSFTSDGSTVRSGCTTTTSSYREPDIVSSYDNNTSYNNGLFTKGSLQEEYNKMIESVNKYHGFYVGRYELGLDTKNNNAPVVKNASTNTNVTTAAAGNSNTYRWYGLYSKCKEFAPEESEKSVVSSMIWGSQYDAMMNWMQKNGADVTTAKSFTSYVTGANAEDCIKNVFDLYGCHREWTLEASTTDLRVNRGGYSSGTHSPSSRSSDGPISTSSYSSARLTLYIK